MISSLIGSIIGGAIIGALARLFMKGKQSMGMIVTIIIGMLSSALTTLVLSKVWPSANDTPGIDWVHLIISIVVATVFISAYLAFTNRNQS